MALDFIDRKKCCRDHDSIEIFVCPPILYYRLPSPGRPWNSQGDVLAVFFLKGRSIANLTGHGGFMHDVLVHQLVLKSFDPLDNELDR